MMNEVEKEEEKNEMPSLEAYTISKPVWFLVRIKSNIEIIYEDEIPFKRMTEALSLVSFDNNDEANKYFMLLQEQSNLEFSIINDYSRC